MTRGNRKNRHWPFANGNTTHETPVYSGGTRIHRYAGGTQRVIQHSPARSTIKSQSVCPARKTVSPTTCEYSRSPSLPLPTRLRHLKHREKMTQAPTRNQAVTANFFHTRQFQIASTTMPDGPVTRKATVHSSHPMVGSVVLFGGCEKYRWEVRSAPHRRRKRNPTATRF